MKAKLTLTDEVTGKEKVIEFRGATVKDIKRNLYTLSFVNNLFGNEDDDRIRALKQSFAKAKVSGQQPKGNKQKDSSSSAQAKE